MMISIAILAILMSTGAYSFNSLHDLTRQTDYREAVRTAHGELVELDKIPFDHLPPQRLRGSASGWLDLGQTDLVVGSVRVLEPAGVSVLKVDEAHGRVQLSATAAGKTVIVDYRFLAPDRGELHTVNASRVVQLSNCPVRRILRIGVLRGEAESPVTDFNVEHASGRLSLPSLTAGSVVAVDYLGERIRTEVEGRSLSGDLKAGVKDGPNKLLRIEEAYGAGQERLLLDLLRCKP